MKIGFYGAGQAGNLLAAYFESKGLTVVGFYNRDPSKRTVANIKSLVEQSDLIFLTVSDDAIEGVSREIAVAMKDEHILEHKIFIHVSGTLTSDALCALRDLGSKVMSMHPLISLSASKDTLEYLKAAYFVLEGDATDEPKILDLMATICNRSIKIQGENKGWYHTAAVVASNYTMVLFGFYEALMKEAGIDECFSREAIAPLVQSTLNNYRTLGPYKGITGPISRGDLATLDKHLDLIKVNTEDLELYKRLGKKALDLSLKEKLKDQEVIHALNRRLL